MFVHVGIVFLSQLLFFFSNSIITATSIKASDETASGIRHWLAAAASTSAAVVRN